MTRAWSRRRPWPYDCDVDVGDGTGYHGLMLAPTEAGLLVGRSEEFLSNVTPTTQEYGAAPVAREATFRFGRLVGGMGERVQASADSRRYRYADGVDCSIGGMPRLGPLFTAESFPGFPGGLTDVAQVLESDPVANDNAVALVGRTAYVRALGAWTLSKDFGAGTIARQAAVFTGATGVGGVWVAVSNGQLWRWTGAAWGQSTLASAAYQVASVGNQLYVADNAAVKVATNDPMLAASWGGAILVGDQARKITWLQGVGDVLYVLKQEGVYTINADGSVNELFPELRGQQSLSNGKNAVPWRGRLWFGYGDAHYALDTAGGLEPVGPERLVENDSTVRGPVVAAAPHGDWFLYAVLYNAAADTSYLMKYGTWLNPESGADPGAYRFADVWHGAIASWVGKRATSLGVLQRDWGGSSFNGCLVVGFGDGTVQYATLPTRTPDPALDGACRFRSQGTVWAPLHDMVFGADKKAFHGVTALGTTLNANQVAQLIYRTSPADLYQTPTPSFTAPGQRLELADLVTGAARDASTGLQLDFGVILSTTASTATPVLEGVAVHEAVRPSLRLQWSMVVDAGQRVARRDGVPARLTPEGVRSLLKVAAGAPGHVKLRLPDESVGAFAAVEYREALAPDRGRDGNEWRIPVRLVQFR